MVGCASVLIILAIFISLQYEAAAAKPPLQIINGTDAEEGEFPYMVQLRFESGLFQCGGSILGPQWILTVAYCIEFGFIDSIVYGTNILYDYNEGSPNTSIKVKNWFIHPNFTLTTDQRIPIYDVGLLQLSEPIPFSENAQPLQLAEENEEIPFHTQGVLSGWGLNGIWGDSPPYLQKVYLDLLSDNECEKILNDYMNENGFNPIHHLCSNDENNGQCYRDSGSPFVINGTAYGIASWSVNPGEVPGGYTRITNPEYRDWIRNITNI